MTSGDDRDSDVGDDRDQWGSSETTAMKSLSMVSGFFTTLTNPPERFQISNNLPKHEVVAAKHVCWNSHSTSWQDTPQATQAVALDVGALDALGNNVYIKPWGRRS